MEVVFTCAIALIRPLALPFVIFIFIYIYIYIYNILYIYIIYILYIYIYIIYIYAEAVWPSSRASASEIEGYEFKSG